MDSRFRILLVEDDKDYSELLKGYLEEEGFEVIPVFSLEEAREFLQHHPVDCLVVDYLLRDGEGPSLVEEYSKRNLCPALLISSHWEKKASLKQFSCFFSVLEKPVDPKELVFQVRGAIYASKNWRREKFLADFCFQHALEGIFLLSPLGEIQSMNETAKKLLDYSLEELFQTPLSGVFKNPKLGESLLQLSRFDSVTQEVLLKKKSGEELPSLISLHPISYQNRLEAYHFSFIDISKLKETQQQYKKSTSRFLAVTQFQQSWLKNLLNLHLLIVDEQGEVLTGDLEFFALCETFSQGKNAKELLPNFLWEKMEKSLKGEYQVWEGQLPKDPDHWYRIVFSPMRGEKGEVVGVLCVGEDITKQKTVLESKIEQSRQGLLQHLTQGIAHEFNNMFTSLQGLAELILSASVKEEVKNYAGRILEVVQRGSELVQRLLEITHVESSLPTKVDLGEFLKKHLEQWRETFETQGISFSLHLPSQPLIWEGDPYLLHKLLHILLENAYHAVLDREKREISLTLEKEGQTVCLSVKDTGQGIPKEHLPYIFDPFFTTKGALGGSKIPGSGLGLSIAQAIVKKYKGTIQVKSEVGQGTDVKVYLPLQSEEEDETRPVV